jgi:hypothetical protein
LAWESQHKLGCLVCAASHREYQYVTFGRCRSGQRWFWTVWGYWLNGETPLYGWTDSEAAAISTIEQTVIEHKTRALLLARFSVGQASYQLRQVNKEKRRQRRPADGRKTTAVDYLYTHQMCWNDDGMPCTCATLSGTERILYHTDRLQIIRRTKRRIYYSKAAEPLRPNPLVQTVYGDDTGYVDRQKIETEGSVYDRNGGNFLCGRYLYLRLSDLLEDHLKNDGRLVPDLRELKAAIGGRAP